MELNQLQTFVVVAEEKSITQAARRLFTTPSSISVQIKTLEDELGVQLFVRTARGMQITSKGEILVEKARQTLQSVRDLVNQATELRAHLIGDIALGINAALPFLRVPPLIQQVAQEAPGITLHLHHVASGRVIEQVESGQLDLGFVFGPVPENRLQARLLSTTELVVAAPPTWDLGLADWSALARHPWICSDYYCPFQTVIEQAFAGRSLTWQQHVNLNDDMGKVDLVASGFGLSLLESTEAQRYADAGRLKIVPGIRFPIGLSIIYLSYRQHDPLVKVILEFMDRLWLCPLPE